MIRAVDVDAVCDYVCKSDRALPEAEQTRWKIGVIDSVTMAKLDQMDVEFNPQSDEAKIKANLLGRELEFVRYGLKGWENFKDKNSQEIKPIFNTLSRAGQAQEILSDKSLRVIPQEVIKELSSVIRGTSTLSEEEAKN